MTGKPVSAPNIKDGSRGFAPDAEHTVNTEVPDIGTWIRMLNSMEGGPILLQIQRFFAARAMDGTWNREAARRFQVDFLQGIFYNIKQNGQLAHEYFQGPGFAELYLRGCESAEDLNRWTAYVVNGYLEVAQQHVRDMTAVERAKEYIQREYATLIHVTAQEIAAYAEISQRHLARLFKRETGMTLTQYIADLRLKKAAELLGETTLPVGEVAACSGFTDTGYFTRRFKYCYGTTPTQYRSGVQAENGAVES